MYRKISVLMALAALLIITLACGSTTTGQKVGESSRATSAPVKLETFKPGDIVKVDEYTITLNKASITSSKLTANFTLDNTSGTKEVTVSSLLSFSAKNEDGEKLKSTFCDGNGQMDGKVLAGDKLKSNVCWDGAKSGGKYKIYYDATLIGSGAIVWTVE